MMDERGNDQTSAAAEFRRVLDQASRGELHEARGEGVSVAGVIVVAEDQVGDTFSGDVEVTQRIWETFWREKVSARVITAPWQEWGVLTGYLESKGGNVTAEFQSRTKPPQYRTVTVMLVDAERVRVSFNEETLQT